MDVTETPRSLVREGCPVRREDVAMLSPYLTSHVKRFGDYVVDLDGHVKDEIPALLGKWEPVMGVEVAERG